MAISQTTFQNIHKLFVLGLPIVGSNLAMMLIGVTDIVMVGWHSVEELAALILATTLFFNIFILGSGAAFALMPMVSSAAAIEDVVFFGICFFLVFFNFDFDDFVFFSVFHVVSIREENVC